MQPLHPQFIIGQDDVKTSVVLPLAEWEQILEELEELDDIRAYDAAKRGSQETLSFDVAARELSAKYSS